MGYLWKNDVPTYWHKEYWALGHSLIRIILPGWLKGNDGVQYASCEPVLKKREGIKTVKIFFATFCLKEKETNKQKTNKKEKKTRIANLRTT